MKNLKVVNVSSECIEFENNIKLYSEHEKDCCEQHWLDFEHITMSDFEGLLFDFTNDNFLEKIEGYGIALKPVNGFPVRIPGYGSNPGYYSSNLSLLITDDKDFRKVFDISECQLR
jgi:hypothetical protein